jgi:hypothetical protein
MAWCYAAAEPGPAKTGRVLRACLTPASLVATNAQRSEIHAELDRVGASLRKAGAACYISVQLGLDEVKLLGPPREHPRRSWLGPEWRALELLAAVPDDAGVRAVWRVLES